MSANLNADDLHALSAAMAAGQPAAIEAFYRSHFERLYDWARQATHRDEAFCLDVVQEAVLRIIRTVQPVSHPPQWVAWLKLVVRTTAYDLLKSEQRRRQRDRGVAVAENLAADGRTADQAEQLSWLKNELELMDRELARMIELRYSHRWTLAKIASVLGGSASSIDGRIRRALAVLRDRAEEAFGS